MKLVLSEVAVELNSLPVEPNICEISLKWSV